MKHEDLEITPRKFPSQARSRATFDAIVTACAWLLEERGFQATTTNHIAERAGVNISSLYEYFPNKDAVVALVAERLVERVMTRLRGGLADIAMAPRDEWFRRWIALIYCTVEGERGLVAVFREQVPYTDRLPAIQTLYRRLMIFSESMRSGAGDFVHRDFTNATLHLVVNVVTATILELVFDPPSDTSREAVLDELSVRVEHWIRGPLPCRP